MKSVGWSACEPHRKFIAVALRVAMCRAKAAAVSRGSPGRLSPGA